MSFLDTLFQRTIPDKIKQLRDSAVRWWNTPAVIYGPGRSSSQPTTTLQPTATPTATPQPTATPTSIPQPTVIPSQVKARNQVLGTQSYLGMGGEPTPQFSIAKPLYQAITSQTDDPYERAILAALSQQESSYGDWIPAGSKLSNVSDVERSFGPFHINTMVRENPYTGELWTEEEAKDWDMAVRYVLELMREQGVEQMLRGWNPGAADYYAKEIPRSARTRRWTPVDL